MGLTTLRKIGFYLLGVMIITFGALYITPLKQYLYQEKTKTPSFFSKFPSKSASTESFIAQQDKQQRQRLEQHIPIERISNSNTHEQLALTFSRLQLIGNYFNREALIEQEILTLLENQKTLEEAQNLLLDNAYAKMLFGEDQAMARVYAIKILEIQAKHLNPEPLISTTAALASQLNEALINNDPLPHNPLQDLEDLLRLSVQYYDSMDNFDDPASIANQLNYQSQYHRSIKEKYDDALFFPLLRRFGREQASAIVANIIEG